MCYENKAEKTTLNYNHLQKMFFSKLKHLDQNPRFMGYVGIRWEIGGYFQGNVAQMLPKRPFHQT